MKRLILLATLILAACAPSSSAPPTPQSVDAIVAQTFQALTAAVPTSTLPAPTPAGLPVAHNNVSFIIPLALNASAAPTLSTDVEYPYINPSGGPMAEHLVFNFTNFPTAGDAKIMAFTASDYASYGEVVQNQVSALLAGRDSAQPLPDALVNGTFYAGSKPLQFQNGHGVRYLTVVQTGFAPVTNADLFYYYQGITSDGSYFIAAIFHVQASYLAADSSPSAVTPPDGIPFDPNQDFNAYLATVKARLDASAEQAFSPSLAVIDQMIQSITITP